MAQQSACSWCAAAIATIAIGVGKGVERGGVGSYLISRRGDTTLNFHISIFMSVYMFHDQPGQYPGQDFLGPYFFKGPYSPPTIWKTYQYYI